MKLQMSFGENLINLRKQKGWSQDDLADNLNLSRQAISKWENDTSKPDIDNIKKISKIFSITIDDLLNNDVVKDKAVTLNVKKEEKMERVINIVKCMIIAVIILYIINVIFKFASLLIIVNGIQKYANLSNYHYVINTYQDNRIVKQEECWYDKGISKTVINMYNNDNILSKETYIDYNNSIGYAIDENGIKTTINIEDYLKTNTNFKYGGQFFSRIPVELRNNNIFLLVANCCSFNSISISFNDKILNIKYDKYYIVLDKENLLPWMITIENTKNKECSVMVYKIEIQ